MEKLKFYFQKYEHIISPATLVLGFIFDFLTLQRVDFLTDNIFILLYLVFAGSCIFIINLYEEGKFRNKFTEGIYEFLPFIMQFAFGGLFSAFVIFYSKSASLFTSGAFVLILASLLVGNEFFRDRYSKLIFQVGIYFVAIFSFAIYFLPVLIRQMSEIVFLGSGVISLGLISIFILALSYLTPIRYKDERKLLFLTVFILFFGINILYFTNIIPPIPLSLKEGDVYHQVERFEGNYIVKGESDTLKEKFGLSQKVHLVPDEPVYVFSSVFSPTDLNTDVTHDWQYYEGGEWVSANKISFPIQGGRNEGYRGFSKKENIFLGKWRVDIKTERGQVLGRVRFDIEISNFTPRLKTKTL